MAYNAVAQADHDTDSLDGRSDASDNSNAHPGHTASANGHGPLDSVLHVIRPKKNKSTASDEYEMVEAEDYECPDPTSPARPDHRPQQPRAANPGQEDQNQGPAAGSTQRRSPSPEPLMRSSTSSGVALRHPTPDLQSLQGAYVGNVERLEEFAEWMSRTSSDLGRELRKLDQEQKRQASVTSSPTSPKPPRSAGSINAVARSGGYASNSAKMLSSPRSSVFSNSRLRSTSVSEPLEEIPLDDSNNGDPASQRPPRSDSPSAAAAQNADPQHRQSFLPEVQSVGGFESEVFDRPTTSHSTDTYRQATNLFRDFDGVHFVPHSRESSQSRQMSLIKPPLAENADHFDQPQAGQDLVYYPAPIPKVLSLPQRLSKRPPISEHNKRRTQLLESIIGGSNDSKADGDNRKSKRLSALPPQLRASVFFDQARSPLDVQVKDHSAVSTLESVLDESVSAPVTAFIDHPMAGKIGRDVYRSSGKKPRRLEKKRRGDNAGQRNSEVDVADNMPLHPGHGQDDHGDGSSTDDSASSGSTGSETETNDGSDEEYEEPVFTGRPATLIAELEMRKQEQKMRNRTAGTTGMHSTLLELDAVAQAQHNARRQKHVTLAWEAEADENRDGEDDEDVPLGILYRSKHPALVEQRPLGLMERRELEENEPLSRRRARLRGEPLPTPAPAPAKRASTMNLARSSMMMGAGGDASAGNNGDVESEDEHETLAQRRHRLKGHKHMESVVSAEFENEIMAEIKKLQEPDEPKPAEQPKKAEPKKAEPKAAAAEDDEEGETLAQRRKRLLAERPQTQHQQQPPEQFLGGYAYDSNRMRHSMANILQAYPIDHAAPSMMDNFADRRASSGKTLPRMASMYTLPPSMAHYAQYSQIQMPAYNVPQHRPMQPTMDERQREFINRWRESVLR